MKRLLATLLALILTLTCAALAETQDSPATTDACSRVGAINEFGQFATNGGNINFVYLDQTNVEDGMLSFYNDDKSIQIITLADEDQLRTNTMLFFCWETADLQGMLNAACIAALYDGDAESGMALANWFDANANDLIDAFDAGEALPLAFEESESFGVELFTVPTEDSGNYYMVAMYFYE